MSVWDKFYRLDSLDLVFKNNVFAQKAIIYGNNKNQVAISVKVKVIDENNNALIIPADELLRCAHLVGFRSGQRLNWKGMGPVSKPWVYTDENYGYNSVLSWQNNIIATKVETHVSEQEVIFYLYATELDSGIDIAAGINIPGVGDFNTSQNGTTTLNGPGGKSGSTFRAPNSKNVRAIQAIDYGNKANINMIVGPLQYKNNFNWTSRFNGGGPYKGHSNGEAWTRSVTFKPKDSQVQTFKDWSISYTPVTNNDVSGGKIITWGDGARELSFSAITGDDYPCSVIHKANQGNSRDQAHINFWYSGYGRNGLSINGAIFLEDNSYVYRCAAYTKDSFSSKDPVMHLYKCFIPENNTLRYFWGNTTKKTTVRVTDEYGNSGEFGLEFNDKDNFDTPRII